MFEIDDYIDAPKEITCCNGTTLQVGDNFHANTISLFSPVKTYNGQLEGYQVKDKDNKVLGLIFLSGAIISDAVVSREKIETSEPTVIHNENTPKQITCQNGINYKVGDQIKGQTIDALCLETSKGQLVGYFAKDIDGHGICEILLSGKIN